MLAKNHELNIKIGKKLSKGLNILVLYMQHKLIQKLLK
jgi:hypothetical protein